MSLEDWLEANRKARAAHVQRMGALRIAFAKGHPLPKLIEDDDRKERLPEDAGETGSPGSGDGGDSPAGPAAVFGSGGA